MKKAILIVTTFMLVSVYSDAAEAGLFGRRCCTTNPVREVVDGTKSVVRGTFCLAGRIVAAPFQFLQQVHKSSCRPCRVTANRGVAVNPRVRLPRTPYLDRAPSPPTR